MSVEQKVRDHFDADAKRFDAIYEERKGPFARWVDSVWRGVVRRRQDLALERLEPLTGRSVLDVGCGPGRYCFEYARRGAVRVVGVDFAPAMINLAVRHADSLGVADRCEFRAGAFPDAVPETDFDAATAMGFFDYIADPVPILRALRERTRSTIVMSFPKAREWRVPIRRLRFRLLGCPLFLYAGTRLRSMLLEAGIDRFEWIELDRDYIIVADLRKPAS